MFAFTCTHTHVCHTLPLSDDEEERTDVTAFLSVRRAAGYFLPSHQSELIM